jgi:hypothetical protein
VQSGQSVFDQDLRVALALVREGVRRLPPPRVARLASRESHQTEDEPA